MLHYTGKVALWKHRIFIKIEQSLYTRVSYPHKFMPNVNRALQVLRHLLTSIKLITNPPAKIKQQ